MSDDSHNFRYMVVRAALEEGVGLAQLGRRLRNADRRNERWRPPREEFAFGRFQGGGIHGVVSSRLTGLKRARRRQAGGGVRDHHAGLLQGQPVGVLFGGAAVAGHQSADDLRAQVLAQEDDVAIREEAVCSPRVEAEDFVVGAAVVVGPRARSRAAKRSTVVVDHLRDAGGGARRSSTGR